MNFSIYDGHKKIPQMYNFLTILIGKNTIWNGVFSAFREGGNSTSQGL